MARKVRISAFSCEVQSGLGGPASEPVETEEASRRHSSDHGSMTANTSGEQENLMRFE